MGKSQNIGRAELEILQFVQDHTPLTVREVANHFAETKGHVRTTILNVMERLRKKGHLTRKKINGVFLYQASLAMKTLTSDSRPRMALAFFILLLLGTIGILPWRIVAQNPLSQEELARLKE